MLIRAGILKENQNRVFNEIVQFSPNELQAGMLFSGILIL
jgi:hypothetical protein